MKQTFLDKGQIRKVGINEKPDYTFTSGADYFSAATNLIPGVSGVSGGRVLLGDKASIQSISLVNREAPLVRSAAHKDLQSFEEHFGHTLAAIKADAAGTITEADEHYIKLKTPAGKEYVYDLYQNFNSGRKSFLHHYPKVKVGDQVKKGDLLATSNFTDDKGHLALGTNLITAVMPYRSNNFEDAFVVTESGAKKLQAEQLITVRLEKRMGIETKKDKYIALFPNKFYNAQLDTLDSDGVVKPKTKLKHGDPIILAYAPKTLKTTDIHLGKLSKALSNAYKDMTETWHYEHEGEVVDVHKQGTLISVNIKTIRSLSVGDKISMGYGAKGVTGLILPDTQAPTTQDGKPVDLILNSMSITSRVAPQLPINLALAKVAKKIGKPIKITPFVPGSSVEKAKALLEKHGLSDTEKLYDPVSGSHVEALVGPLYINRLIHIAEDKLSDRAQGVGYDWDQQPTKSGEESAKRLGNLSTTALLSHHAPAVLRDIATVRATKNDEFWRRLKLGLPAPAPQVPFIFNKFVAMLQGAGIKVDKHDSTFQILPQTDKDVEKLSAGAIDDALTFTVKHDQLHPEKGGLFDPNKVGILGERYNHVNLQMAVPNPISEDLIRRLLKLTKQKYEEEVISGEVARKLHELDVDKKMEEYRAYLKSGKVSDRDNAAKVLTFLTALKKNQLHPKDLVLTKVPVIPAMYRPAQFTGDLVLESNANKLYKDLILANNALKRITPDTPPEIATRAKQEVYKAVKAVAGLGDPISVKNKEKNVKGLLAELLGVHGGSAKGSMFQAKVVNKPLDLIGRGVATGDVRLDLDEISIPQDIAWKIYSPFLIRRLVQRGVPATQAHEYVKNKNPLAIQSLHEEMRDRPVIMSRDPALHKFNMMGFMPRINPDPNNKTVSVNPLVFKGFNLDLDGDQINVGAPAGDDAKEEIKEKMLPSRNLLSVRSFAPIYIPSNEAALGLFQASSEDNKNKPKEFKSEEEVIKAFNLGQLKVGDRVKIVK